MQDSSFLTAFCTYFDIRRLPNLFRRINLLRALGSWQIQLSSERSAADLLSTPSGIVKDFGRQCVFDDMMAQRNWTKSTKQAWPIEGSHNRYAQRDSPDLWKDLCAILQFGLYEILKVLEASRASWKWQLNKMSLFLYYEACWGLNRSKITKNEIL